MDWERPNINRIPMSKSGRTQRKFNILSREVLHDAPMSADRIVIFGYIMQEVSRGDSILGRNNL